MSGRRRIDCCQTCARRSVGCHGTCAEYAAQKAERAETLDKGHALRRTETDVIDLGGKRKLRVERYYHHRK